jgi:hypothetical protein
MRHRLAVLILALAPTGCAPFSWQGAAGANIQGTAYARSTWLDPTQASPVTSQPPAPSLPRADAAEVAPPRSFLPPRTATLRPVADWIERARYGRIVGE